jgi:2-iminobutanoate/2-iminopropanoate deaminase
VYGIDRADANVRTEYTTANLHQRSSVMIKRQVVKVPGVAHFSPIPLGARVGNVLCSSGIMGMRPETGNFPQEPARQVEQAFVNLREFLKAAGGTPENIVDLEVHIRDQGYMEFVNVEWAKMFPDPDNRPARNTLQAAPWRRAFFLRVTAVLDEE